MTERMTDDQLDRLDSELHSLGLEELGARQGEMIVELIMETRRARAAEDRIAELEEAIRRETEGVCIGAVDPDDDGYCPELWPDEREHWCWSCRLRAVAGRVRQSLAEQGIEHEDLPE